MNDEKLKKLFELSREETAPVAPEGFEAQVMAAMRRPEHSETVSLWEQLERLFPRVAVAAVLVMGICLLADAGYSAVTGTSLSADVNEISEQWLFAAEK